MTTKGPPAPRDFPELGELNLYAPPEPPVVPEPPARRPGIQVAHSFGPPADSPEFRTGQLPERPAWDRAIIPPADPGFLRFIADQGVGVTAVFRLPDSGHIVIWRRAQDDPGRYVLTTFHPADEVGWVPTASRERMDIWAAYEEAARVVIRKAGRR